MATKDNAKNQLMHFKSNSREIMIGVGTDDNIEKILNLLLYRFEGVWSNQFREAVLSMTVLMDISTGVIR